MFGSTIIHETDPTKFAELTSMHGLDAFTCVELNALVTMDFEMIVNRSGTTWLVGKPVVFDEDGRHGIFRISPAGLAAVLRYKGDVDGLEPEDVREDQRLLRQFIAEHGDAHIYELATF